MTRKADNTLVLWSNLKRANGTTRENVKLTHLKVSNVYTCALQAHLIANILQRCAKQTLTQAKSRLASCVCLLDN